MNEIIDIYCERTSSDLLSEPLNLISNTAFIIAGIFVLIYAQKKHRLTITVGLQGLLIIIIGIGSALFHSFATQWAMFADVIPILIFQIIFLASYTRNIVGLSVLKTSGFIGLFLLCGYLFSFFPRGMLNGSLGYAPALLFIFGFGLYHKRTNKHSPWSLILASGLFLMSLIFRSIDHAVCETLPIGTHYFWHLFNAGVLALVSYGYIRNIAAKN